ncbi:MAG: bactofilin family protein [Pseudomonadota bacterium]
MFDKNRNTRDVQPETDTSLDKAFSPEPETRSASASSGGARAKANIGSTIRIKGDVSGDENLHIEGYVEGTVSLAEHELIVGASGKVHADIMAKLIRIDGEVQGDITGKEKVIISPSGNVRGNIFTPRLTLEDGARFKGSIDMDAAGGNSPSRSAESPTINTSSESKNGASGHDQKAGNNGVNKAGNKGGADNRNRPAGGQGS